MNGMKCSNCRFVSKIMNGKKVMEYKCVRYAPKPYYRAGPVEPTWPLVYPDNRCGEWKGVKIWT